MAEGEDRVYAQHPNPDKQGVRISRDKYDAVRKAIEEALGREGTLTFTELRRAVADALDDRFEGSVGWYYTTVKLDLEARGVIERVPGARPQQLRLSASSEGGRRRRPAR